MQYETLSNAAFPLYGDFLEAHASLPPKLGITRRNLPCSPRRCLPSVRVWPSVSVLNAGNAQPLRCCTRRLDRSK